MKRWALGYYAVMASAGAVAALLAVLAGSGAEHRALLPDLMLRVAALLGAVNLAGAAVVFSPVHRFLAGRQESREAAAQRISALARLSGLWVAALEIQACLERAVFAGGIRLRARVGVSTGRVVGGTVGGDERLGYTVHGDTVNLASRLEELNKQLGTRILVSSRTAELVAASIPLRDRGTAPVRGFVAPLRVFEPLAASVKMDAEQLMG